MPILAEITVPLTIYSPNRKEHWAKTYNRHKKYNLLIRSMWNNLKVSPTIPCHVKLTRISQRKFDYDNLVIGFKGIRDIVADLLIPGKAPGQADSNPNITWEYTQEKGPTSIKITFIKL